MKIYHPATGKQDILKANIKNFWHFLLLFFIGLQYDKKWADIP